MKTLFTLILAIGFATIPSISQDIVTKKTGEDIQAKVVELTTNEIKYKRFDNLNGPIFTVPKSDVLMIRYENGSKDVFADSKYASTSNMANEDMAMRGKNDALKNYTGKNSGAGWTAAASVVLGPLLGLIPAGICASTKPAEQNLNYKEAELMKDYSYSQAYTEQAHKIKKKKVWTNYGLGSGAWLLLILVL